MYFSFPRAFSMNAQLEDFDGRKPDLFKQQGQRIDMYFYFADGDHLLPAIIRNRYIPHLKIHGDKVGPDEADLCLGPQYSLQRTGHIWSYPDGERITLYVQFDCRKEENK